MGLREKKAARTRARILDVALELFADRGYEATTMEEIADRAEIGSSTLYRYFPSKDLILLEPFTHVGALSEALRARPADEPLGVALAAAIHDALGTFATDEPRLDAVRAIVDRTPGPRARLWDLIAQDRELLEQAVADRVGGRPSDVYVAMTTRVAQLVIELAADTWRGGDHRQTIGQVADGIIDDLARVGVTLPARSATGA